MSEVLNCVESQPCTYTLKFNGIPINLTELCKVTGVTYSYLSLILNGKRVPSIPIARKVSMGLGMEIGEFIESLEKLWETKLRKKAA